MDWKILSLSLSTSLIIALTLYRCTLPKMNRSVVSAAREQQRLHDNGRWFFHRRHRQSFFFCSADWRLDQIARCKTKHGLNTNAVSFLLLPFSCVCNMNFDPVVCVGSLFADGERVKEMVAEVKGERDRLLSEVRALRPPLQAASHSSVLVGCLDRPQ